MTEEEISQLAADYIGFFVNGANAQSSELRAVEHLWRLCRDDASLAFRIIWVAVHLVDGENLRALAFLGTGPLEDLINFHGPDVTGLLLEAARENRNLCIALSCVWRNGVKEDAWEELSTNLPAIREQHGKALIN